MNAMNAMNARVLRTTSACLLALACAGSSWPTSAHAETKAAEPETVDSAPVGAEGNGIKTKFIIDDADPENHVPSAAEAIHSPLEMGYWVMLVSDRALEAKKRGDLASTVKYYRALAKASPDIATSFTRVCGVYETMGDRDDAIKWCRVALDQAGVTLQDYAHFIGLLAAKPELTSAEFGDADHVLAHIESELQKLGAKGTGKKGEAVRAALNASQLASEQAVVQDLRCQLGVRTHDRARLASCTTALRTLAPHDPKTLAFGFAFALMTRNLDQAAQVLETAKQAKLPESAIALMQQRLDDELAQQPLWRRLLSRGHVLSTALLGLFLCAAAALYARRRLRNHARPASV